MTRIELLGRVAVVRGDAGGPSVGLPGRRAELVFAYLAAEHRRVVSPDELADALWPERLPDSWAAAVRGVVAEVRRYLNDAELDAASMLERARRGYQIRLPPDVVVDVDEARDELARARSELSAGAAAGAARHAARAAELARLPFLPSHEGAWVDGVRREIESLAGRALELEARAHGDVGDLDLAVEAAGHLVRAEPLNETAHQLLITLLGRAGDRAGATKAFEQCRALLAEELDADPSGETVATFRQATHAGSPSPSPSQPAAAGEADRLADYSVLVVEDHDFQRRMALRLLENLGVGSLSEAANGAVALELLAGAPPPDVILCDIDMPEMDGVQFIRRVAQGGLAGAVIIASGLDPKVLAAVEAIGASHGLQVLGAVEKPLNARRLGDMLRSYYRRATTATDGAATSVTAAEVEQALATGRITTRFEPRVDLGACQVAAVGAVAGWAYPSGGWIHQSAFSDVLTSEPLRNGVTDATLGGACAQLPELDRAGFAIGVGIGVGPSSLSDTAVDGFLEILAAHGVDAARFTCEVSEDVLGRVQEVLDVLTRLRVKGFGLSLGHFGSRQLPMDRLAHLPLTEVKIDGRLVTGAAGDERRIAQLEAALEGARSIGVPVVAAGCEDEADFDLLLELGCRFAEGPFVGGAMTGADLVKWAPRWAPP